MIEPIEPSKDHDTEETVVTGGLPVPSEVGHEGDGILKDSDSEPNRIDAPQEPDRTEQDEISDGGPLCL
jgi:hypothetical protein